MAQFLGQDYHKGSWGGLPDFGISERIGNAFGGGRTAQGGSNLMSGGMPTAQLNRGGQFQPLSGPGYGWGGGNDVLGASTHQMPAPPAGVAPVNVQGNPGGNNGGVVNGTYYPDGQSYMAAVDASRVNPYIDEAIGGLNDLKGGYQTNADEQITGLQQGQTAQQATVDQSAGAQKQDLGNANDQARRTASEILQGIQGRYGGSTGEGSFASAQTGQGLQSTVAQINNKIAQVDQVAGVAKQNIEAQTQQQITGVKQWLQQSLAQIQGNVSTLQSHKADLAFQALQQYQQYVQNLELGRQQALAQIAAYHQGSQQQLNGYMQQIQGFGQNMPQFGMVQGVGAQQAGSNFSNNSPGQGKQDDYLKQLGL